MKYHSIVEQSEEGLTLICKKAEEFERDSILPAIQDKRFNEYDIEQLIIDVEEYHAKLKREILSVNNFARTFNSQYATDNNLCFETAERLFRKIRSTLCGTKKIYRKFCLRVNRKTPKDASIFSHSAIACGNYSFDLYGEDSYPECVKKLCDEMEAFFEDLIMIIRFCQRVIREEEMIRNNPRELKQIYIDDCNHTRRQQEMYIRMLREDKNCEPTKDPMDFNGSENLSFQNFLKSAFHKYNRNQFVLHVVSDELKKGRMHGLDREESMLWADNHDIVPKVRIVLEHFDELDPQGSMDRNRGVRKINSKVMVRLMKWCGLENSGHEKNFIEGYFVEHYHGMYLPVKMPAVNTAKRNLTVHGDPEYEHFESLVNELLRKYHN
jgi:hypothetical protein